MWIRQMTKLISFKLDINWLTLFRGNHWPEEHWKTKNSKDTDENVNIKKRSSPTAFLLLLLHQPGSLVHPCCSVVHFERSENQTSLFLCQLRKKYLWKFVFPWYIELLSPRFFISFWPSMNLFICTVPRKVKTGLSCLNFLNIQKILEIIFWRLRNKKRRHQAALGRRGQIVLALLPHKEWVEEKEPASPELGFCFLCVASSVPTKEKLYLQDKPQRLCTWWPFYQQ